MAAIGAEPGRSGVAGDRAAVVGGGIPADDDRFVEADGGDVRGVGDGGRGDIGRGGRRITGAHDVGCCNCECVRLAVGQAGDRAARQDIAGARLGLRRGGDGVRQVVEAATVGRMRPPDHGRLVVPGTFHRRRRAWDRYQRQYDVLTRGVSRGHHHRARVDPPLLEARRTPVSVGVCPGGVVEVELVRTRRHGDGVRAEIVSHGGVVEHAVEVSIDLDVLEVRRRRILHDTADLSSQVRQRDVDGGHVGRTYRYEARLRLIESEARAASPPGLIRAPGATERRELERV